MAGHEIKLEVRKDIPNAIDEPFAENTYKLTSDNQVVKIVCKPDELAGDNSRVREYFIRISIDDVEFKYDGWDNPNQRPRLYVKLSSEPQIQSAGFCLVGENKPQTTLTVETNKQVDVYLQISYAGKVSTQSIVRCEVRKNVEGAPDESYYTFDQKTLTISSGTNWYKIGTITTPSSRADLFVRASTKTNEWTYNPQTQDRAYLYVRAPANFVVVNISADKTPPFLEGTTVNFTVGYKNNGDLAGSDNLMIYLNDNLIEKALITAEGGQGASYTKSITVSAGSYTFKARFMKSGSEQTYTFQVQKAVADFYVERISLNKTSVVSGSGDTITVSATISNKGNITANCDVEYLVDGSVRDTKTVYNVAPNSTATVGSFTFDASVYSVGTHTVRARIKSNPDRYKDASFTVNSAPPSPQPNIQVYDISLSGSAVLGGFEGQRTNVITCKTGTTITATVYVKNTGNADGTATVNLYVDGSSKSSQNVSVKAGATTTINFSYSESNVGTHKVKAVCGNTSTPEREYDVVAPITVNVQTASDGTKYGWVKWGGYDLSNSWFTFIRDGIKPNTTFYIYAIDWHTTPTPIVIHTELRKDIQNATDQSAKWYHTKTMSGQSTKDRDTFFNSPWNCSVGDTYFNGSYTFIYVGSYTATDTTGVNSFRSYFVQTNDDYGNIYGTNLDWNKRPCIFVGKSANQMGVSSLTIYPDNIKIGGGV
jgi:archaellum component FlaG (FlaF/FlaG flagellin family)